MPDRITGTRPAGLRNPGAIYATGLLGMGYTDLYIFLIPLYGLSLGMSAGEVGVLASARHVLALLLSIHIGVLMDRFGTRRVTLFFVWVAILLAPAFPLVPWFWGLILLQIVHGGALSFGWSGSQTLIAQLTDGDAEYIGRFNFFARIGTTIAPIIVGAVWDLGGVWPAYLIGIAWGILLTVALLRAPEAELAPVESRSDDIPGRTRFRVRDTIPRMSDYIACFSLIAIPAVAATMCIFFLRNATNSVQFSLYVVYLDGIGMTGTAIGALFSAIEIAAGLGSLFAGRAMRLGDPQRTMLSGTVLCIFLICVTPFLGGIFALLLAAQVGRGWLQGVVQPMMFSVQAKAVGRYRQGAVVGLRQTMNRLSSMVIPPVMGLIADRWSITVSFVALGTMLSLLCIPIVWINRRAVAAIANPIEQAPGAT
jgi:MFS family permease